MTRFKAVCWTMGWGAIIIGVMTFVIWAFVRDAASVAQQQHVVMARCAAMGGEAILAYSYNSDDFYVTGCKVQAPR